MAFIVEVKVLGKWIRPLDQTYDHTNAVLMKRWFAKHFNRAEKVRVVPVLKTRNNK